MCFPVGMGALRESEDDRQGVLIPAPSRMQAREWSLVLNSQEIEHVVVRSHTSHEWGLMVAERDEDLALHQIKIYQSENQGWGWTAPVVASSKMIHPGAILWLVLLVGLHLLVEGPGARLREVGMMDVSAFGKGAWWLSFTAVTLHADWSHMISNFVTGLFLLGLAMHRYGPGVAIVTSLFAGVFGNVLGYWLYEPPHYSLGASGMILGALGMLAVESLRYWKGHPHGWRRFAACLVAGIMMFLMSGVGERTDLVAHFGGFLGGALLAIPLSLVDQDRLKESGWQMICASLMLLLTYFTWWRAMVAG